MYCLLYSSFLLSCSPETSSRVNLASLGIVFQTNLAAIISECINKTNRIKTSINSNKISIDKNTLVLSGCFVVWLFCCFVVLLFCCLEDNTERSESNPGRSLGIITEEKRAVWKTVPDNMLLRLRLCPHALKKFTDNTDATDFIFSRI